MFTGIIEDQALVTEIKTDRSNRVFTLKAQIAPELRPDESVAHNGACLTVEEVDASAQAYQVTAIKETLSKTMLGDAQVGDYLNLERALRADSRLDGHFVQGHVDCLGQVIAITEHAGSTDYQIQYPAEHEGLVIGRGSICINGISLTVAHNDATAHTLSVSIIPHTINRTNIGSLKVSQNVNLEFDMLGKYVLKLATLKATSN